MSVLKCSPARAGLLILSSGCVIVPLLVTIEYAFVKVKPTTYFCVDRAQKTLNSVFTIVPVNDLFSTVTESYLIKSFTSFVLQFPLIDIFDIRH